MAADGTWKIAIETPMGTRHSTLVLKSDGGALNRNRGGFGQR
jgi:hypothetical protein